MRLPFALSVGFAIAAAIGHGQAPLSPKEALHQAFANRATIAASRQRLREAQNLASAAGAYPATRLDLGRDIFNQADIMGSADLLLYQPIDIFGKSRALRKQGDAGVTTAIASFRQGALDVQQEVLTAYANLLSAQRLLALAKSQRDLAESVRVATSKRVDARALAEVQGFRAALEVEKADGLVADREAAVVAASLRFAGALGADVAEDAQLAALDAPPDIPGDQTAQRPELMTLRADEAQAAADERVAKQGLLPDLEIQAGRSTFHAPPEYGARLQLTANLWDHGANRSQARAAAARRKAATLALEDRQKAANKDIEAAKVELAAAEKAYANYTKLSDGTRTLLERTRLGFDLGGNTLTDVLDARRALSDAQELAVNAQLRRDLAIEGVLRAEGRFLEEPK